MWTNTFVPLKKYFLPDIFSQKPCFPLQLVATKSAPNFYFSDKRVSLHKLERALYDLWRQRSTKEPKENKRTKIIRNNSLIVKLIRIGFFSQ